VRHFDGSTESLRREHHTRRTLVAHSPAHSSKRCGRTKRDEAARAEARAASSPGDHADVSPEAPDAPEPEKRVTRATERFLVMRGDSEKARDSSNFSARE
jgi:hypothetical protein